MGYFSFNCKKCGDSLKAPLADAAPWQNEVVVVENFHSAYHGGTYDGYGRIAQVSDEHSEPFIEELTLMDDGRCEQSVYHQKCWDELSDEERAYTGPSESAKDQGYFINVDEAIAAAQEPIESLFKGKDNDGNID